MERVASGVGCFGDKTWHIYKTKSRRFQLQVRDVASGEISKEWVHRLDVPEYAKHASWLKSKSLLG